MIALVATEGRREWQLDAEALLGAFAQLPLILLNPLANWRAMTLHIMAGIKDLNDAVSYWRRVADLKRLPNSGVISRLLFTILWVNWTTPHLSVFSPDSVLPLRPGP